MCDDMCMEIRRSRRGLMGGGLKGAMAAAIAAGLAKSGGLFTPRTPARRRRHYRLVGPAGQSGRCAPRFPRHPNCRSDQGRTPRYRSVFYRSRRWREFDRVLATALQSGAGPDIVPSQGPGHAGTMAKAGLLIDIQPYAEQYGWREKMLPWALGTGYLGDKLSVLPNEMECTSPTTVSSSSKKRDGPRRLTGLISKPGRRSGWARHHPHGAGIADCGLCTNWLVTIFFNTYAGPDAVYQALTGEIPFSDPVFVDSITLLNDYMQKGWIGGGVEEFFSTGFDTVHTKLADGEGGMAWEGTWFLSSLKNFFGPDAGNDNSWDWAQTPAWTDAVTYPTYPLALGSTLSVSTSCDPRSSRNSARLVFHRSSLVSPSASLPTRVS